MVQRMGRKAEMMFSDSRLVVGQVKGELEARDERMHGYLSQVRRFSKKKKVKLGICNQDLNHSAYCTSLEMEKHTY